MNQKVAEYRKILEGLNLSEEQIQSILFVYEKRLGVEAKNDLTLKHGPNVINLVYYAEMLTEEDIQNIENSLAQFDLELSRFDKSWIIENSIHEYSLQALYSIPSDVVDTIVLGAAGSALWDAIKSIIVFTWQKVKFHQILSSNNTGKNINFGVRMATKDKKQIDFKLEGHFSPQTIKHALDRSFDILDKAINKESDINICVYEETNGEWRQIFLRDNIQEKVKQSKNLADELLNKKKEKSQ